MSRPTPEQQLEHALRMQAERERQREEEERRKGLKEAAKEMGVSEDTFDAAEAEAQKAEAEAQERARLERERAAAVSAQRSKQMALGAAIGLGALLVTGASLAWWFLPGAPPVQEDFSGFSSRWGLDMNPGTEASVQAATEAGHGEVAEITVGRFVPGADGKFHVNLNLSEPMPLDRLESLSVAAKGDGLGVARVYLEVGDERWRSPPMNLGAEWKTFDWSLEAFERQERKAGGWTTVDYRPPDRAKVSIKVGHFMNPPEASGTVWVDDLVIQ